MSNLHNLQGVIIEMSWYSYHMTQTKHENMQTMETTDTGFFEKSFIDISFLVLKVLTPTPRFFIKIQLSLWKL